MRNNKRLAPVGATVAIVSGKHTGWYAIIRKYCPVMIKVIVVDTHGQRAKKNIYLHREAMDLHVTYAIDQETGQYRSEQTAFIRDTMMLPEATVVNQGDQPHLTEHETRDLGEMMANNPVWPISQRARMAATDDPVLADGLKKVINRMATLGIDTSDGVKEVVQIAMREYRPSTEH